MRAQSMLITGVLVLSAFSGQDAAAQQFGQNLVVNPGAETGSMYGWTLKTVAHDPTNHIWAIKYGGTCPLTNKQHCWCKFPTASDPGPPNRGSYFFAGGYEHGHYMHQNIDVSSLATKIDSGNVKMKLSAYLGGCTTFGDTADVKVRFLNSSGGGLGPDVKLKAVTMADRNKLTKLLHRTASQVLPKGTRKIKLSVETYDGFMAVSFVNGYVDDLSIILEDKVTPKADLRVTSLTPTYNGTSVTFSAQICNQGTADATAFDLGFYYHQSTQPTCLTTKDAVVKFYPQGLKKNHCAVRTVTRTGTKDGTYKAWAMADANCHVAELNETNNSTWLQYKVETPDLYISAFTASVTGKQATFSAKVCNKGKDITKSFTLGIYHGILFKPGCSGKPTSSLTIAGLKKGACETKTYTRGGLPDGSYTAWLMADSGCAVAEASETNNAQSVNYAVGNPDLYIKALTAKAAGKNVTFSATVCNKGKDLTSGSKLSLFYDLGTTAPGCTSKPDASVTIASLASNKCETKTFVRQNTPNGTFHGWVMADQGCAVTEADENNNTSSTSYSVERPDLSVSQLLSKVAGKSVTFTTTVCNQGAAVTSPFDLSLYYHLASAPTCATTQSDGVTIASLGKGKCKTHVFTRANTPGGGYNAWALADAGCKITESDEANNHKTAGYVVSGPDLKIASVAATVQCDKVAFSVQVCNQGATLPSKFTLSLYGKLSAAPSCTTVAQSSQQINGLAKGKCETRTFNLSAVPDGLYTTWFMVDSGCAVQEPSESDNTKSAAYAVDNPDLYVSDLSAKVTGASATITAKICNKGKSTSAPWILAVHHDPSAAPTCKSSPSGKQTVSGLTTGNCVTRTFLRAGLAAGGHTSWIYADGSCGLCESDETNNSKSVAYAVGAPAKDAAADKSMDAAVGDGRPDAPVRDAAPDVGVADGNTDSKAPDGPADAKAAGDMVTGDEGPDDGCDCRLAADTQGRGAGALLLLLLALAARRRWGAPVFARGAATRT